MKRTWCLRKKCAMFSCFRGYQLHNPFHTIWATKIGNNLAVSFYIRVYSSSVLAVLQDRLFEILRDQPPKVANFFPSVLPKKNAQIRPEGVRSRVLPLYMLLWGFGERGKEGAFS